MILKFERSLQSISIFQTKKEKWFTFFGNKLFIQYVQLIIVIVLSATVSHAFAKIFS